MKQLLEFIPLVLFFITYKMFGVRDAAIVLVIATIVQMIVLKLKYGVIEKQQKIMAIAVVFFGLLTAYFNEGKEIQLPDNVWNKLNLGWAGFFILCMLVNIYISQNMSEDAWVDFKSFGLLGMTFVATIISGAYIYRYLPKDDQKNDGDK
ncbi:MAG: inner membrane-spanning protein YciB [Haemophilus parainfluenzae]|nr:inner membrane-spanning protein YciB [Haemophilus parainfluenzae]